MNKKIKIAITATLISIIITSGYIIKVKNDKYKSVISQLNQKVKEYNILEAENKKVNQDLDKEIEVNISLKLEMEVKESEAVKKIAALKQATPTLSRGAILNQDKVTLLAKLIQSEALSESYEAKLWVGSVVINRMRVYDKSMREIIYQRSQFSGIYSNLFNSEPSRDCIKAAEELLSGNLKSKKVLYFVNLNVVRPAWINNVKRVTKVGVHTFYRK